VRVLVTYAVEPEFAAWRELRMCEEVRVGCVTANRAQVGLATVDFVVTGMGPENARRVAESVMTEPYKFCICAGFAGSLKPRHRVGDILAAKAVQQAGKTKTVESRLTLVTLAVGAGATEATRFITSDSVVATAEEKARLAPFGDAVDMESFAVLDSAKQRGLSAVPIRVISDRHDQGMPVDFGASVDEHGRVRIGGVVRMVARHPLQVPALIRLGRESKTAAEGLAHFLEAYIKQISFATHGWPTAELAELAASRAKPKATA